ncbi:cupin domain-containing protein [Pedobacter jejuensis]|uniref:Cupin domain-containing protein n=1 Tax=Pedobacter jejuensis TaxID=1268550 RepID=A0A3N0BWY2_9SPHI|nr:cupin domain-containing protein [Pedobacter jejuensis]RNL54227.1 cupin domain-containing protein [Pedobacter jejuensis]
MKRNKFIAAIATLIAAPALSFSQLKTKIIDVTKGFKINSGEGRIHGHMQLKGVNANILDVKISGSDTNGALAIFEQTSLSQGKGTPLHIHDAQDEVFYVIEGAYYFKVGDDTYDLKVGDSIFLPRKIPHAWTQVSERGKMIVILQPAGKLENFFLAMANLKHEPNQAEIAKIFSDNGMNVVGPPLKLK